jgi:DNA-binding LacI/PurR family transcriptional regulator
MFPQRPPTIDIHFEKIGRLSAEMLLKKINSQNDKESEIKMFEPQIVLKKES